jgi:YD repeat-containing protein
VTNPLGKVAEYHWYHGFNPNESRLTSVVGQASSNCVGSTRAWTYDRNGFIASETDEEGRVTAYVRDDRNRPTSITRGSGSPQATTTTLTWHPTLNIATRIVEPGLTTNVAVDAYGHIVQIQKIDTTSQTVPSSTSGQSRTTSYSYSRTGLLTSVDGPLPGPVDAVAYSYNADGNIQTITDLTGRVTSVNGWNSRGQPTSITDPNGAVTTLAYEPARGLLTQMTVDVTGTPATTTIQYDQLGQIFKITQPNGAFESYVYDAARRLVRKTNSAGETVSYRRNANGDVTGTAMQRADGSIAYTRVNVFDELGRLIRSIGANAQAQSFAYDRTNNLASVADPRGNLFRYGFDPLNRLISETDEEGKTVNLARNGSDDLVTYTDARNLSTSYVRNGFGEVIQEISPDRGTITYWRDVRGLVTQRVDARGVTTNYAYDRAGRLTDVSYPNQPGYGKRYIWDASTDNPAASVNGVGRLIGMSGPEGSSWIHHDARGWISKVVRANDPAGGVATQYNYDAAGNVIRMTYPSGRIVTYACDAMGRVSGVTTQQNAAAAVQTILSNVQWNPYGPPAQMSFGYGGVATFTTDTDYRITRYQVGAAADPGAIIDRSLIWIGDTVTDIVDNKNSYASPPQSFAYTPTRRLAMARGSYGVLGWSYDANGNRLTETTNNVISTYVYPTNSNRLAAVTTPGRTARSFAYDASGDIVADTRSGALGMSFQYDVEGRLSKAYQTNALRRGRPTPTTRRTVWRPAQ